MKKKLVGILLVGMMVLGLGSAALAWEFSMKGAWIWGYDYIDQGGPSGFFGNFDQASAALNAAANPKFNTMNAWVGDRTINDQQYGIVTGSDASLQWMRAVLEPEIRLNPAVRLRGVYQIGNGINTFGLYANNTAFGAYNVIASGTWTQWWGTAQTPWGILIGGKRPFAFGMGAQYDGTSASSESFGIITPYGPFRFGFVCYPWRGQTWVNSMAGRAVASTTLGAGPQTAPVDALGDSSAATIIALRLWDNDRKRQLQPGAFFTYSAGSIEAGLVYEWWTDHNGPGGAVTNARVANSRTYDVIYEDGSAFVKFNNGRFFLNTEVAMLRGQQNIIKATTELFADFADGGGSRFAPYYLEAWKFMAEAGFIAGPAKLSFLYSWVPGPDRQHGIWINKQSWENVVNGSFLGNAQAFLPYSLLMSYQYGAGLLALNRNGEGYMTDASSYGGRLDYSLAANLNLSGSFFYSNRVSKGWGWGCLVPAVDGTNGGARVLLLGQQVGSQFANNPGFILAAPQNTFAAGAPSIPDNNLGWEVTVGADWKLLDGLTASFRGARWQPGEWFQFACVDKTLVNQITPALITGAGGPVVAYPAAGDGAGIGSQWGVNPSRTIDPIYMFQGTMTMDF